MTYDKYQSDSRYEGLVKYFKDSGFNGHPRFYELIAAMACTHADKNHDYAGDEDPLANFRECERFGVHVLDGIVTRISDKDSRFRNWFIKFRKAGSNDLKVKDEHITDTLIDRAVYSLLLTILIEQDMPPQMAA